MVKLTPYVNCIFWLGICLCLTACGPKIPEEIEQAIANLPETIDYNTHVKPILSDRCFSCHGNDKNKLQANLRLDTKDAYHAKSENSKRYAIVPQALKKSEVFHRLISTDVDYSMPPPESNFELSLIHI